MSTRVQQSWDRLLAGTRAPDMNSVDFVRQWLVNDLAEVSSLLQPKVRSLRAHHAWRHILDAPLDVFAVSRSVWRETCTQQFRRHPVSYDPSGVWQTSVDTVWNLFACEDPNGPCPETQHRLDYWWSDQTQELLSWNGSGPAYHAHSLLRAAPQEWKGDVASLILASKQAILSAFPKLDLLPSSVAPNTASR